MGAVVSAAVAGAVVPVSLVAAYPTPALLAEATEEGVKEVLWQADGYQHATGHLNFWCSLATVRACCPTLGEPGGWNG